MEYRATIRHLAYLQDRYNIKIETHRPKESVPVACKKYGLPIFSKFAAEQIGRLQNLGFSFSDGGRPYEELIERYGIETDNSNLPGVERVGNRYYRSVSPIRWWCNKYTANGFNIDRKRYLKEFMIENPPQFSISSLCCDKAKKSIAHEILNSEWVDLNITGIRKAEGGIRSMSYRTCFNFGGEDKADLYMPVFWYTDADKKAYEEIFDIKHSDCYTVYGFRRTGCAACPFGGIKHCNKELIAIKEKEPNLYRAAHFVFDKSYKYMREFENYRRMVKRSGK